MEWHIRQDSPDKIDLSFPAPQADALRAACAERTAERARFGNSPFILDTSIVEIIDENQGESSVSFVVGPEGFRALPEVVHDFAVRTSEVAETPDPLLSPAESLPLQRLRCDLGDMALTVLCEIEGAVAAYDSDFHGQLDTFMNSLNPEG